MKRAYHIMAINPGSTSTKLGVFAGAKKLFDKTVRHDAQTLAHYESIAEQLPYRRAAILAALTEADIGLADIDAFVGRGGGLLPMEGGTYEVNTILLKHAREGANGVRHPAQLGPLLAHEFAEEAGARAFVVNPPDTDELCDDARMTGVRGIYRHVHLHALNLKEMCIRHAAAQGTSYRECNFVACHLGGGVSVSAHRRGRMIDGFDIVGGDGPMAPTRSGGLPIVEVLDYLDAGHSTADVRQLCMKSGGFVSLANTSDAIEVKRLAAAGNAEAARAWSAMLYQIKKCIGAMACALDGRVDAILLGGGMAFDEELVSYLKTSCSWIAPVMSYPGEFELEAMAAGAMRVLLGEEEAKSYTGVAVFQGFVGDDVEPAACTAA